MKIKPYKVKSAEHHPVRGYLLSNGRKSNSFVFTGETEFTDGSSIFATPEMIDESLNAYMLKQGQAYGEFYLTLPAELRMHLQEIVKTSEVIIMVYGPVIR